MGTSCFPAVKYDGYVMTFQFSVCNKLTDNRLPFFLQVPVLSADEIVPVYDDRRNCPASGDNLYAYYSIALACQASADVYIMCTAMPKAPAFGVIIHKHFS